MVFFRIGINIKIIRHSVSNQNVKKLTRILTIGPTVRISWCFDVSTIDHLTTRIEITVSKGLKRYSFINCFCCDFILYVKS